MQRFFRLTNPDLDCHVDVTVHERRGRFMATADLAEDSRDVGNRGHWAGGGQDRAAGPGEPYASAVAAELALGEDASR